MAKQEKVIKGLEWILNDIEENGHYQVSYYADEIRKALALLKEPEIVRCRDCMYYNSEPDSHGDHCNKIHWSRGLDWFCADGERR